MDNKIGVIIQGPLITYGQGPNNTKEGFETFDTIIDNINNIQEFGFEYTVSIWEPINQKEELILNKLITKNININVNQSPKIFDPDHRYKHHYGIFLGFNELITNCDLNFFVKIRTDMLMPVEFWDWVIQIASQKEIRLYVSELSNIPFYIGDFVYAAEKTIFETFLKSIINFKSDIIHPTIACDISLKYYLSLRTEIFKKKKFHAFFLIYLFVAKRKYIQDLWNSFNAKHLGVLPQTIWINIIWRRRKIGTFLNPLFFCFTTDLGNASKKISFYERFSTLFDSYKQYYAKRNKCPFLFRVLMSLSHLAKISNRCKSYFVGKFIAVLFQKKVVIGRVACLGRSVFESITKNEKNLVFINQQKTRLDLLMKWINGYERPITSYAACHLSRLDIIPLIEQQENLPWFNLNSRIDFFIMDSFSELTDQEFRYKYNEWSFCCHYSDINHTNLFNESFECLGLLPIDKFNEVYNQFFDWFQKNYPNTKVFFIHFSTKFDDRINFKERALEIRRVMDKIEKRYSNIYNIFIDENNVNVFKGDNFPYHYSNETIREYVKKWKEVERNANS